MLVQYKSIKVLKETHVEARQGHFTDMSVTVWFPAVNVAPVPFQTAVKWKNIHQKQNNWDCHYKPFTITTYHSIVPNAWIFCCERTWLWTFSTTKLGQICPKYYIWKTYNSQVDIGRIRLNTSMILCCNHIISYCSKW